MKKKIIGIFVCMLMIVATIIPVGGMIDNDNVSLEQDRSNIISRFWTKWVQQPDNTSNGISICVDRMDEEYPRWAADDFKCTKTGKIIKINLWGSWYGDTEYNITEFRLSIHKDIPAGQGNYNYSMPGEELWRKYFFFGDFESYLYDGNVFDSWWDPYTGGRIGGIKRIYQYNFTIPKSEAFMQNGTPTKPIIYWLAVHAISETGEFGWKASSKHWNDDAVYYNDLQWNELKYPNWHPCHNESIDMAFQIITYNEWYVEIPKVAVLYIPIRCGSIAEQWLQNWSIGVGGDVWYPPEPDQRWSGTIEHADANETVIIKTGFLFGCGFFNLMIELEGFPPVTKKGFILSFVMFIW